MKSKTNTSQRWAEDRHVVIDGKKYIKGITAIKHKNRWKRLNIDIFKDCMDSLADGFLTKSEGTSVITGFNESGEPVIGVTQRDDTNMLPCVHLSKYGKILAISEQLLEENDYIECINDGLYYHQKEFANYAPRKSIGWREINFVRDPDDPSLSHEDRLKYGLYSPTNLINENKKYSFGVEIESYDGMVPDRILSRFNVRTVRDGSVRDKDGNKYTGAEYVSGIMFGDHGFKHIQELCYELNKRVKVNNSCSVHVHIGNCIFNKDFTVYAYMLAQKIQDEIFEIVPKSRLEKNPATGRMYCQKLPSRNFSLLKKAYSENYGAYRDLIEDFYNEIFYSIGKNHYPGPLFNKSISYHPDGRWCDPRYYWINFVGFNFKRENTKDSTIEFRFHSASTNFIKIKNLILLGMGIAYYIENFQNDILNKEKITLKDVIDASYPKSADKLVEYVESRKKLFAGDYSETKEYTVEDKMKDNPKTIKEIVQT